MRPARPEHHGPFGLAPELPGAPLAVLRARLCAGWRRSAGVHLVGVVGIGVAGFGGAASGAEAFSASDVGAPGVRALPARHDAAGHGLPTHAPAGSASTLLKGLRAWLGSSSPSAT